MMGAQSDRIVRELEQSFRLLKLEFARRLLEKLRERTPVRTGRTRSRWVATELGHHIDVSNDAGDAVMRLNDGSSRQVAAGFIEQCIDETLAEMEMVIRRPLRLLLAQGEVLEYIPAEAA